MVGGMVGKRHKGLHTHAFPPHRRTSQICALPIKSNLKLTLFALSERVDADTGETWAGAETLAPLASLSVRRFRQHLKELLKMKLIEKRTKTVDGKTTLTRIFRLKFLRPDPKAMYKPPADWPKVDKSSTLAKGAKVDKSSIQTGRFVHPDWTNRPSKPDKSSTNQDISKQDQNIDQGADQSRQQDADIQTKAQTYLASMKGSARLYGSEKTLDTAKKTIEMTKRRGNQKQYETVKLALERWQTEEAQAEATTLA